MKRRQPLAKRNALGAFWQARKKGKSWADASREYWRLMDIINPPNKRSKGNGKHPLSTGG